jgi:sugar (pentulose or hexulose) kinase
MRTIQGFCRTQRRHRQREGLIRYNYRGYPCNVLPDEEMWYVAGMDGNGGGILEWCTSEQDAKDRMRIMKTFPQFANLRVGSNAEDNAERAKQLKEKEEQK